MEVQQFVSITPWTMIFQICNLLILCLLMKKFLFKPVNNILKKRQQEIDDVYAAANEERDSAAEMKNEYTMRMAAAREEADGIVRNAVDEAGRKGDEILSDAHAQAAYIRKKAEDEIERERRSAYAELKNEIGGIAVDIAQQMIAREINSDDQSALVEDFLRNAGDDK